MTDVTFTNISQGVNNIAQKLNPVNRGRERRQFLPSYCQSAERNNHVERRRSRERIGRKEKQWKKSMINLQSKAKHSNNQQKREESETLNAVRRIKVWKKMGVDE